MGASDVVAAIARGENIAKAYLEAGSTGHMTFVDEDGLTTFQSEAVVAGQAIADLVVYAEAQGVSPEEIIGVAFSIHSEMTDGVGETNAG